MHGSVAASLGGAVKGMFGYISVTETNTHVIVDGVRAKMMLTDISNYWSTGRIAMHMFTTSTWRKLVVPKFFLIDLHYMVETLAKNETKARLMVARRQYNDLLMAIEQGTWLKDLKSDDVKSPVDLSKLSTINTDLFDYQIDWIKEFGRRCTLYNLKGGLLPFPPGKGKTLTAYALAETLPVDVVVIFCPANTVEEVWESTAKSRFTKPTKYWSSRMGTEPDKDCKYFIYHYEAMEMALRHMSKFFRNKRVMVVVDESHNFNTDTKSSQRSNNLQVFCKTTGAVYTIFSSGTPIKALGSEMINFLRIIDPLFNKFAEERFILIFGKSSTRAADILARRIGVISYTPDFPEEVAISITEIAVKVKMPNAEEYTLPSIGEEMRVFISSRKAYYAQHMSEYHSLFDQCIGIHKAWLKAHGTAVQRSEFDTYWRYMTEIRNGYNPFTMREQTTYCNRYELTILMPTLPKDLRKGFKDVRSIIKYVDLKIMGEALGSIFGGKRAKCHVDMVRHIDMKSIIDSAEAKSLVFTTYVEVVDETYRYLGKQGYDSMRIYGDTNSEFNKLLDRFKTDPDFNPGIATYQSLSTGVPMVMANVQILVNQPFREYIRRQTVARVARIGQIHPVRIYSTTLDTGDVPNISTRQQDILQWSKEQVEAIMGISAPDDVTIAAESLMDGNVSEGLESIGGNLDVVLMSNRRLSKSKLSELRRLIRQHQ